MSSSPPRTTQAPAPPNAFTSNSPNQQSTPNSSSIPSQPIDHQYHRPAPPFATYYQGGYGPPTYAAWPQGQQVPFHPMTHYPPPPSIHGRGGGMAAVPSQPASFYQIPAQPGLPGPPTSSLQQSMWSSDPSPGFYGSSGPANPPPPPYHGPNPFGATNRVGRTSGGPGRAGYAAGRGSSTLGGRYVSSTEQTPPRPQGGVSGPPLTTQTMASGDNSGTFGLSASRWAMPSAAVAPLATAHQASNSRGGSHIVSGSSTGAHISQSNFARNQGGQQHGARGNSGKSTGRPAPINGSKKPNEKPTPSAANTASTKNTGNKGGVFNTVAGGSKNNGGSGKDSSGLGESSNVTEPNVPKKSPVDMWRASKQKFGAAANQADSNRQSQNSPSPSLSSLSASQSGELEGSPATAGKKEKNRYRKNAAVADAKKMRLQIDKKQKLLAEIKSQYENTVGSLKKVSPVDQLSTHQSQEAPLAVFHMRGQTSMHGQQSGEGGPSAAGGSGGSQQGSNTGGNQGSNSQGASENDSEREESSAKGKGKETAGGDDPGNVPAEDEEETESAIDPSAPVDPSSQDQNTEVTTSKKTEKNRRRRQRARAKKRAAQEEQEDRTDEAGHDNTGEPSQVGESSGPVHTSEQSGATPTPGSEAGGNISGSHSDGDNDSLYASSVNNEGQRVSREVTPTGPTSGGGGGSYRLTNLEHGTETMATRPETSSEIASTTQAPPVSSGATGFSSDFQFNFQSPQPQRSLPSPSLSRPSIFEKSSDDQPQASAAQSATQGPSISTPADSRTVNTSDSSTPAIPGLQRVPREELLRFFGEGRGVSSSSRQALPEGPRRADTPPERTTPSAAPSFPSVTAGASTGGLQGSRYASPAATPSTGTASTGLQGSRYASSAAVSTELQGSSQASPARAFTGLQGSRHASLSASSPAGPSTGLQDSRYASSAATLPARVASVGLQDSRHASTSASSPARAPTGLQSSRYASPSTPSQSAAGPSQTSFFKGTYAAGSSHPAAQSLPGLTGFSTSAPPAASATAQPTPQPSQPSVQFGARRGNPVRPPGAMASPSSTQVASSTKVVDPNAGAAANATRPKTGKQGLSAAKKPRPSDSPEPPKTPQRQLLSHRTTAMDDPHVLREMIHSELQRRKTRSYSHRLDGYKLSEVLIDRTPNAGLEFLAALRELIDFTPGVIYIVASVPKSQQSQEKKDVPVVEKEKSKGSQTAPIASGGSETENAISAGTKKPDDSATARQDHKGKAVQPPTEVKLGSHTISQPSSLVFGAPKQRPTFGSSFFTTGPSAAAEKDDDDDDDDEDGDEDDDEDGDEDDDEDGDDDGEEDRDGEEDEDEEDDDDDWEDIDEDEESGKDTDDAHSTEGNEDETQGNESQTLTSTGTISLQQIRPVRPLPSRRRRPLIPAPIPTPPTLPIRDDPNLSFSGLVGAQDIPPSEPQDEAPVTPNLSISDIRVVSETEPATEEKPELSFSAITVIHDVEPIVPEEPDLEMSNITVVDETEPVVQEQPALTFSDIVVIHENEPIVQQEPEPPTYSSSSQGTQTDLSMFDIIPEPPEISVEELALVGPTTLAEIAPTPQPEPTYSNMSRWTYSRIFMLAVLKVAGKSWLSFHLVSAMMLAVLFTYTELTW